MQKTTKLAKITVLIVSGCLPVSSLAGEIYGRIAKNGAVFPDAEVTIKCTDFTDSVTTNSNGAYRSKGPSGENQCKVSVGNLSNSVTVYTSQGRTRANLEVKGDRLYRR